MLKNSVIEKTVILIDESFVAIKYQVMNAI